MTEYVNVVETAKLIRAALKTKFPTTKFSVTSSKYAGGASIDVSYTDGPVGKEVEAVVKPYSGSGFDGMIDMKYSKTSYMLADGTVTFGKSEGTGGSMGSELGYEETLPEGAKKVRFGSDYVFVHRYHSVAAMKTALQEVSTKYGYPAWAELEVTEGFQSAQIPQGDKFFMNGAQGDHHWSVSSLVSRHLAGNE